MGAKTGLLSYTFSRGARSTLGATSRIENDDFGSNPVLAAQNQVYSAIRSRTPQLPNLRIQKEPMTRSDLPTTHRKEHGPAAPRSGRAKWRDDLYVIIFEADTFAGQLFDIMLLGAILLSITVVSLETVEYFETTAPWPKLMLAIEWTLTLLFTAEYLARLICVHNPLRYAFSFFGLIDLLACLPLYLTFISGVDSKSLTIVRSIRLLRVFRVLKMMRMLREAQSLQDAVWKSRDKIFVFVAVVMVAVTISGTLMYQIEHEMNPIFSSIPQSMYWAIVTMTTVGYGDIVPKTVLGKVISATLILLGYSLIIVPTGFVSAEIQAQRNNSDLTSRTCPHCLCEGHSTGATFCNQCGERLVLSDTENTHPSVQN